MRHVESYDPYDIDSVAEPAVDPVATSRGATQARQAGQRMREVLDGGDPRGRPSGLILLHSATPITARTAELFAEGFSALAGGVDVRRERLADWLRVGEATRQSAQDVEFLMAGRWVKEPKSSIQYACSRVLDLAKHGNPVIIVIGHDPPISWLLHELAAPTRAEFSQGRATIRAIIGFVLAVVSVNGARRWLHQPESLPLRRGEMVMMTDSDKDDLRPVWAISPSSNELIAQLRIKISAKMDSAKQLGAFATALFTFAVTGILKERPTAGAAIASWIGVAVLGLAVVAFFATLFRYDALLMPPMSLDFSRCHAPITVCAVE